MRYRSTFFLLSLALSTHTAEAADPAVIEAGPDWDLTLSGQIRPRFIVHSGRDFRGSRSEWREFVTQRARFGAAFESESGVGLAVELQDVRAWGEETSTFDSSAAGFDAHQAFAVIPVVDEIAAIVGRQEIAFDRERLVGTSNWTQTGRSFDSALVRYEMRSGLLIAEAFYAKIREPGQPPEAAVPDGRSGDVDFGGLHASLEPAAAIELAPMYLIDSDTTVDLLRHTIGMFAEGDSSNLVYGAEFYYQTGHLRDERVNAFLGSIRAGYTLDLGVEPGVLLWAELMSGEGTRPSAFDTLYGSNHTYYGELDFFATPADTAFLGLIDVGGRLGTGIVPGLRASADAHYFATDGATARGKHDLGVELDFRIVYEPMDYVELTAFYGVLLPGEAMRDVRELSLAEELTPESLGYVTLDVAF